MPDPILLLKAMAVALAAAAAVVLICGWPWRAPRPRLVAAATVVSLGAGFYPAAWLLGLYPRLPPRTGIDRFLVVLFPAVIVVELLVALVRMRRSVALVLRGAVAGASAYVLLLGSTYLSGAVGADSAAWSPAEAALTLGGLAAALAAEWFFLDLLMRRSPGRAVPLSLALSCAGAALVSMLSGYASGPQLGFALAACLAGVCAASIALPAGTDLRAALGPAVGGLFALLVISHFFSNLATAHAGLLFAAPLLCWLPEASGILRAWPRVCGLVRVALVAVPVALVAAQAARHFAEASRPAPDAPGPTLDDYANYGR